MNVLEFNVPPDLYFSMDALSQSALKRMRHSPLMFKQPTPYESTAMKFGSLVHTLVLEPGTFADRYAVWDRRSASGKLAPRIGKEWDAFKDQHGDKEIVNVTEKQDALAAAAAVHCDPVASRYFQDGEPEVTMSWEHRNRRCKGRADWVVEMSGEHYLVGLKTSPDCRPEKFCNKAASLGYHLQWAWYALGYERCTGVSPRLVEIVVESKPPYPVVVYQIPQDVIEVGRQENEALLSRLEWCEQNDQWPGPASGELEFQLPAWCYRGEEVQLDWEGVDDE